MSRIQASLGTWRGRVVLLALVGALVAGQQLVSRATAPAAKVELRTAPVARATITQTVSVSGTVNAAASYKLSFKTPGKLTEVLVAVGDQVQKDQPLARIDTSDLRTALATAQANLNIAQARYDALVAGADPRDVADAKRAFDKLQANYAAAKNTLQLNGLTLQQDLGGVGERLVAIRDQLVKVQGQLQRVAQPFATTQPPATTAPPGNTPEPTQNTSKADARTAVGAVNQAQSARDSAESVTNDVLVPALGEYAAAYAGLQSAVSAFDAAFAAGGDATTAVTFFLNAQTAYSNASTRLTSAIDSVGGYVATISSNVSSANAAIQTGGSRGEINLDPARYEIASAQTMLLQLQQLFTSDKTKITQATSAVTTIADAIGGSLLSQQSSFQKATATPKPTDVLQAMSTLQSAQTALQNARDNLEGATIRAPSPGTVATILNQVGENVTGTVMTMANTSTLTLRGTIGEADVARLRAGQVATITVDAVGATATARMTGKVGSIDPVATIQQGVPVYGVDVQVDVPAPGVRAGMSGTAAVIIATRQDVLAVPNLAIRSQGTRRYVQVLKNGQAVDAVVTFGISNETVTEVSSGLQDGDVVVLPQPRTSASATPRAPGPGGFGGGPVIVR